MENKKQTWYERNKEKVKAKQKQYYKDNLEKIKEYRKNNKDKIRESNYNYYVNNNNIINEKRMVKWKEKYQNDQLFKIKHIVRSAIRRSMVKKKLDNVTTSEILLGCSYEEFKTYLESKFESWMNWDNYGLYNNTKNFGWDIDHIIPLSTAKTVEDIIKLCHYTNLQPLCSYTNRYIKRNKVE